LFFLVYLVDVWFSFCYFLFFLVFSLILVSTVVCFFCSLWFYFSRMRSKGSRFTLGVWGLRDIFYIGARQRGI
jgi:hypothetical protein